MLTDTLFSIFERDVNRLIDELNQYKLESNIWKIENNIKNSAGNLCLHLIGNLNTYIGKEIGNIHYVRYRESEFLQKNIPLALLIQQLNETISVIKKSLIGLEDEVLKKEYPILVLSEKTSTEYFLVHLTTHLTYHLGQINYHRRLLDK